MSRGRKLLRKCQSEYRMPCFAARMACEAMKCHDNMWFDNAPLVGHKPITVSWSVQKRACNQSCELDGTQLVCLEQ